MPLNGMVNEINQGASHKLLRVKDLILDMIFFIDWSIDKVYISQCLPYLLTLMSLMLSSVSLLLMDIF